MHARFFVVIPPQACLRFLVFFFFLFFSFCVLPYPPSFSVFKYPFPFACLPKSIIFRCGCLCSRDYGIATVYRAWGWVRLILQDIHWVEEVLFPEFLLSISLHNGGTSISVFAISLRYLGWAANRINRPTGLLATSIGVIDLLCRQIVWPQKDHRFLYYSVSRHWMRIELFAH